MLACSSAPARCPSAPPVGERNTHARAQIRFASSRLAHRPSDLPPKNKWVRWMSFPQPARRAACLPLARVSPPCPPAPRSVAAPPLAATGAACCSWPSCKPCRGRAGVTGPPSIRRIHHIPNLSPPLDPSTPPPLHNSTERRSVVVFTTHLGHQVCVARGHRRDPRRRVASSSFSMAHSRGCVDKLLERCDQTILRNSIFITQQ